MKQRYRHLFSSLVSAALVTGLAGCDWSSGGGADGYNTSRIRSSVAGVYRSSNAGAPLVTNFKIEGSGGVQVVKGEQIGTGDGSKTTFSGTLSKDTILPGTVKVFGAGFTFSDNRTGTLVGSPSGSGSITYNNGAISVDFGGVAPSSGDKITVDYSYDAQLNTSASSGASATTIYSFNVQQTGDRIRIIDNNGDAYDGRLGSTQVDQVIATGENQESIQGSIQFEANGNSRGIPVRIVGTFNVVETVLYRQGTTIEVDDQGGFLDEGLQEFARYSGLTMDGTWIEPNAQGNIAGIGPQNQQIETTGN